MKTAHIAIAVFVSLVCTAVLAAIFGTVVYGFGFGLVLIGYVGIAQWTDEWRTRNGVLPATHRDAIIGQIVFLALALVSIVVGLHSLLSR